MSGPQLGLTRLPGIRPLRDLVVGRLAPLAFRSLTGDHELVELNGHRFRLDTRDVGIAHEVLLHGAYESTETLLFAESVPEGGVVLDVGANVGIYTVIAAERVGPQGRVYALEPDPANFSLLCENVALNGYGDRVVVLQKAVADASGQRRLVQHDVNLGLHHLNDDAELEGHWVSSTMVETVSLDGLIEAERLERVDVVKLDVEGAEGLVVDGARRLLASERLTVFSEWRPDSLRTLGYDPVGLVDRLRRLGFCVEVLDEKLKRARELEREEALAVVGSGGCLNLRLTKA